jgi:hypothetical protein
LGDLCSSLSSFCGVGLFLGTFSITPIRHEVMAVSANRIRRSGYRIISVSLLICHLARPKGWPEAKGSNDWRQGTNLMAVIKVSGRLSSENMIASRDWDVFPNVRNIHRNFSLFPCRSITSLEGEIWLMRVIGTPALGIR